MVGIERPWKQVSCFRNSKFLIIYKNANPFIFSVQLIDFDGVNQIKFDIFICGINKTKDPILDLTPENIMQHSRIG